MIIDLFAGAGGTDEGLKQAGITEEVLGIEWLDTVCRTARAAGHPRLCADVTLINPLEYSPTGLLGSPSCQGFSSAGLKLGHGDSVMLLEAITHIRDADDVDAAILYLRRHMKDDRSILVLEPLRWALRTTPRWLLWEQVPAVLPIWQTCAEVLRRLGWSVEVDKLHAEQFGTPQTRTRAFLVARSPEETAARGPAKLPKPTHGKFNPRKPIFDPFADLTLKRWVSIRQAFIDTGLIDRFTDQPWHFAGAGAASERTAGQIPRSLDMPAHTVTGRNTAAWLSPEGNRQATPAELGVLQGFRADYPWVGSLGERQQQVGDCVPVPLAAAVVSAIY